MIAFEVPSAIVVRGAITGVTYGLLSVGLVLVYRTNRVINFAHGQIGLFGAAVFLTAWDTWNLPYYLALPVGLAAAAAAAVVAEVAVVRRLRKAPLVMSIVATLGVGQFLIAFASAINPESRAGNVFPRPPGLPEFELGPLLVTQEYVGMLVFGPVTVGALALFLRKSRFGVGIRAASDNPEAARLSGVSVGRMSSIAWGLSGVLSAITAVLVLPASGFTSADAFGPSLLLRALAGAVVAKMYSLPRALIAGVAIGIVEDVLTWNYRQGSLVEVVLYGVILVALILQRDIGGRTERRPAPNVQKWKPLPESVARLPAVRFAPFAIGAVALAFASLLPLWVSSRSTVRLIEVLCFAMVGLSIVIVTGLGGQLSLGQFAIAGVGAVVSYRITAHGGSFYLSLVAAAFAAALVSLVIGMPTLRIRGPMLTVTTLGFAVVSATWLFGQPWMLGSGVTPGRPIIGSVVLDTSRSYYYFTLVVLTVLMLMAWNVKRGGIGRRLEAVRDNEDAARSFAVVARVVKVQGFLLAGMLAGLAGATYGYLLSELSPSAFPIDASIDVVAMTVIGGTSLLAGPLLGALYIVGLPTFVELDSAGLAATQLGWLILILYVPGGLAELIDRMRWWYARAVARRSGIDLGEPEAGEDERPVPARLVSAVAPVVRALQPGTVLLEAVDLHRRFGGVVAVEGVSLRARAGEVIGLIGPNGAGKTTTFELLSGSTRPDHGQVLFAGEDISRLGPEQRAQCGLIRSFQDAALFPTMTVLDTARLAFERHDPTRVHLALLGLQQGDRRKDRRARELLGMMGLDAYRNKQIRELSTGTRRIVELACLIALQPTLLLLDEPSSGIAQRETEALGHLLLRIRQELELTLVVIEHDMPLIMGLADRIVAMESGRVIADGTPAQVRADPGVVAAYLGANTVAIERSGATTDIPAATAEQGA